MRKQHYYLQSHLFFFPGVTSFSSIWGCKENSIMYIHLIFFIHSAWGHLHWSYSLAIMRSAVINTDVQASGDVLTQTLLRKYSGVVYLDRMVDVVVSCLGNFHTEVYRVARLPCIQPCQGPTFVCILTSLCLFACFHFMFLNNQMPL